MKITKYFLSSVLTILCASPISSGAAEFYETYLPSSPKDSPMACSYDLTIKGEIKKGDARKTKWALDNGCYERGRYKLPDAVSYTVVLNSNGGDVNEAIEMGRIIRAKGAITRVWYKDACLSSCVFVLAGGQMRIPLGKIGIHRPYFSDLSPNAGISEIQQSREKLFSEISKYFRDMDIASSLADEMMSIPPEKMKILTESQLEGYRLKGTDAAYEEKLTAEYASKWNLTSAEYRKRDLLAESKCGLFTGQNKEKWREFQVCLWSVMLDIPKYKAEKKVDAWVNGCPKEGPQKDACVKNLRNSN